MRTVDVVSVNVGRPEPIGMRSGRPVSSAIHKHPVVASRLRLSTVNLEGDAQADLRVHGGPDKAVYAYPGEHLDAWSQEFEDGSLGVPGVIGENLTLRGVDEEMVHVGDVWRWGEALLQVAQPREPCYKLAMWTGHASIVKRFEETGRTGIYLRVLQPGAVPVSAPLTLSVEALDPAALSIRSAYRLARAGADPADVEKASLHPALAESWRAALRRRLDRIRALASGDPSRQVVRP